MVLVTVDGSTLAADKDDQPIPKKGDSYDYEKLSDELKKIKDGHPDKTDLQVASEDTVKFETLVRTMDAAMTARFPDVSLIDSGGAGIQRGPDARLSTHLTRTPTPRSRSRWRKPSSGTPGGRARTPR